jgi:hypothetical protein
MLVWDAEKLTPPIHALIWVRTAAFYFEVGD